MINVPAHQPDVYNIDRAVNDGWSCVGNRFDQKSTFMTRSRGDVSMQL